MHLRNYTWDCDSLISESNLHSELEVVFSLPVVFLEVTKGYPQLGYQEGPFAQTCLPDQTKPAEMQVTKL